MPRFSVQVDHQLDQSEAVSRLQTLLEKIKTRYQDQLSGIEESWAGNILDFKFSSYGFKIKGVLTASGSDVKIDGDLPFAAMMFKGRIEQTIRDELVKLLS